MGRKESYSERLRREGGMVASGKFKEERREATCECCRRNDAPEGERLCLSCIRHHDALVQKRNEYAERLQYVRDARAETEIERQRLTEELASVNADRHRLEVLYEEARREQHRWEDIAAERGTRMDEIQARAEAAEAALAEALALEAQTARQRDSFAEALATTRQALTDALDYTECKGHCADGGCPFCGGVLNIARRALADTGGDTKEPA